MTSKEIKGRKLKPFMYGKTNWEVGFRKWPVLPVQYYCIYADIVGGSEKVQNYADVIYGWCLKVSKSRKQFMVASILPKNERNSLS